MIGADSDAEYKKHICIVRLYLPEPTLRSGDIFTQGTLALVPRVYPELRF